MVTLLGLLGLTLITCAATLVAVPLGVLSAGVCCCYVAYRLEIDT